MRFFRSLLALLVASLASTRAEATPNFPDVVRTHLSLSESPACAVCHEGTPARGTVTTPFGAALRGRGLLAYNDTSLTLALDALNAEKMDSDGDGDPDIAELSTGSDPNVPAGASPIPVAEYGCDVRPARSQGSAWAFWLLVAAAVPTVRSLRKREIALPSARKRHPENAVQKLFEAAHYDEIVRQTVDGATLLPSLEDTPYVIGALAFLGRIEEARALWSATRPAGEAAITARFALGVAYCRAGRMREAEAEFRKNFASAASASTVVSERARFFVFQGLACYRYFQGMMAHASRLSLRALGAAFRAGSQYGRLLSTDLRGHALVQMGQTSAGLLLLEQAAALATSLGLDGNANAFRVSESIYRARFLGGHASSTVSQLEERLRGPMPHDSYSCRLLTLELAAQKALSGAADEAWSLLDPMLGAELPDGDARARVRLLLACALVARIRHNRTRAEVYLAEATRELKKTTDRALEVDALAISLFITPEDASARAARLRHLAKEGGFRRALRYACIAEKDPREGEEQALDTIGFALESVFGERWDALARAVSKGYLGLFPVLFSESTDPKLAMLPGRQLLLAEDGAVRHFSEVPEGSLRLLLLLRSPTFMPKEALLLHGWGIRVYRPERHDAIVHTAVSRLRALFGAKGHLVEADSGAYRLSPRVEVYEPETSPRSTLVDAASLLVPSVGATHVESKEEVLRLFDKGPLSTSEFAAALRVSEMTAFRKLKALLDAGQLTRDGRGKNTRYATCQPQKRSPHEA